MIALPESPFLYPLTASGELYPDPGRQARMFLAGGARILQIRAKGAPDRILLQVVEAVLREASAYAALVFVNDRVDVALAAGAHGVHVGHEDLPVAAVRRMVGAALLIGCSTHSESEALRAAEGEADYVALGPIFRSTTKQTRAPLGLDVLRRVRERTRRPLVAIGGVRREHLADLVQAGADGVAVISAAFATGDVTEQFRQLSQDLSRSSQRASRSPGAV